jgi:hypothetical protein
VYGMIEEDEPGNIVLYFVKDRTAETLQGIIEKHVERDTTVHTDGWPAYEKIYWDKLGLNRVKHIHLNARTLEHSNHIEGLWGKVKYQ